MDLATTPAMAAPDGETTNFNPGVTEIQRKFITIYAGTLAAATITLALRIWTRLRIVHSFWADDYAAIGAWLMDIGFFVCCMEWMQYGFGDHLWNVSLAQLVKYAEWATPVVTTYCWAPMLSKFSILLLYYRVNPGKWFRCAVLFLMFMIFSYTIATTLIVAAGCKPTDASKTQCINNLALAQAILNIASDFFVIILPLPMIYKLKISVGQKVALALILAAGSLVVVASIVRLAIIQNLPNETDTTWVEAAVCVWSAIEINVGLMCNCLVVLKPFVKQYLGMFMSSLGSTGGAGSRSKLSNPLSNSHGWRNGSYQLGSVDASTVVAVKGNKDSISKDNKIFVSSSFTVEQSSTNKGSGRIREADCESQEEIVKKNSLMG